MAEGKWSTHKRPVLSEADLRIVCQKDTKQKLMKVSRDSLESLDPIRQLRLKLRSDNFRDTTDWFTVILQAEHINSSHGIKTADRIIWVSPKSSDWGWLHRKEWPAKYRLHPHQCPLCKMSVYGPKSTDRLESVHLLPAKEKSITSSHTWNERQQENIGGGRYPWPGRCMGKILWYIR